MTPSRIIERSKSLAQIEAVLFEVAEERIPGGVGLDHIKKIVDRLPREYRTRF